MYKCDQCGDVFDEPNNTYEQIGDCFIPYDGCPHCRSDSFESVELCDKCGEPEAVSAIDTGYCAKCRADIMKRFDEATKDFSEQEMLFIITTRYNDL